MNKMFGIAAAWLVVAGLSVPTSSALAKSHIKVSKAQAEQIALAKAPGGEIKSSELEHEKGALVWSFDIATPGTRDITEVLVDANTGAIVEVAKETPSQQQAETKGDAKAAARSKHP